MQAISVVLCMSLALAVGGCASQPATPPGAPIDAATAALPVARLVDESDLVRSRDYPLWSRRLGEQGDVTLKFWVDEHGVASRPEVAVACKYPRLDAATLDWLREAKPRFIPLAADNKPVAGWQRLTLRWRLH